MRLYPLNLIHLLSFRGLCSGFGYSPRPVRGGNPDVYVNLPEPTNPISLELSEAGSPRPGTIITLAPPHGDARKRDSRLYGRPYVPSLAARVTCVAAYILASGRRREREPMMVISRPSRIQVTPSAKMIIMCQPLYDGWSSLAGMLLSTLLNLLIPFLRRSQTALEPWP